jgi:ATP-binding cassette subfamily B protein
MALPPLRLDFLASQNTGREVMRLLWRSVTPFWRRTAAALVLLVIAKLATVAVPLILKRIIDSFSRPEELLVLPVFLLLAYALLRFAGTLFGELRDLAFSRVAQSVVAQFSARAFEHLLRLNPRFHARRQTGRLTREVERGTSGIGFLLGMGVFTIVPTIVEILAVLGVMVFNYSDWFTALIIATFVVYTSFTVVFTSRRQVHQRAVNELDSRASSRLVDGLLNYETVKATANEDFEAARFRTITDGFIEAGVRNQRALSTLHVGQSAVIAAGVGAIMLLAGQSVVQGAMSVGDLVLVNAYVIQICLPLNALGFVFRQASDALVDAEKLLDLLRERPDIREAPDTPPLAVDRAEVRFEDVSFGYESSRRILWNVDFRIPPGATVAVVGGSGSGKSTLARLLMRFYDVESGAIRVDGQDIRAVTQKSLRGAIGIVPQDTMLFNDTIAYNIAYGRPGAGLAEVIEAAKAAQLHDFICSLPEQYDTVVGERGLKLSGGEKQRIAIARVVLRNPRILVFDEATSALDARAERAIQEELERLSRERTTLVIAHRMSTIINAAEILVLEHGRIVERGTHAALLEQRGLYAHMWALQQQEAELQTEERKLALQPVNLAALAAAVIDALRPQIDAKGIRLYNVLGAEAPRVTGDPGLLQQALWDLCVHAVHVTPPGGRMEIEVARAGPNARVKVSETHGAGAGAARVPLELARIREVAEQHSGRFRVEPLPAGSGTSYVIELPLRAVAVPVQSATARPRLVQARGARASLEGARIMVVDDQDDARDLLAAILVAQRAQVQPFAQGEDAVRWFEEHPHADWPDLLICDIALQDTDGYHVVRRIRAIEAGYQVPVTARMPAIALTGFAGAEDRTEALIAGFQLHLAKPVEPAELLAAAASLIETERAAKALEPPR